MVTVYVRVGKVGKEPFRETWLAGYHPDSTAAESFATIGAAYAQNMAREFVDRQTNLFAAPKEWPRRFKKHDPQFVQGLAGCDPNIKGGTFANFHYTVGGVPLMSVKKLKIKVVLPEEDYETPSNAGMAGALGFSAAC